MARSSMVSRLGIAILSVHTAVALTDISSAQTVVPEGNPSLERVSALGRIDPHNGVFKVAGPPRAAVVIKELLVDEGDSVDKDQIVAVLLGIEVLERRVGSRPKSRAFQETDYF